MEPTPRVSKLPFTVHYTPGTIGTLGNRKVSISFQKPGVSGVLNPDLFISATEIKEGSEELPHYQKRGLSSDQVRIRVDTTYYWLDVDSLIEHFKLSKSEIETASIRNSDILNLVRKQTEIFSQYPELSHALLEVTPVSDHEPAYQESLIGSDRARVKIGDHYYWFNVDLLVKSLKLKKEDIKNKALLTDESVLLKLIQDQTEKFRVHSKKSEISKRLLEQEVFISSIKSVNENIKRSELDFNSYRKYTQDIYDLTQQLAIVPEEEDLISLRDLMHESILVGLAAQINKLQEEESFKHLLHEEDRMFLIAQQEAIYDAQCTLSGEELERFVRTADAEFKKRFTTLS